MLATSSLYSQCLSSSAVAQPVMKSLSPELLPARLTGHAHSGVPRPLLKTQSRLSPAPLVTTSSPPRPSTQLPPTTWYWIAAGRLSAMVNGKSKDAFLHFSSMEVNYGLFSLN